METYSVYLRCKHPRSPNHPFLKDLQISPGTSWSNKSEVEAVQELLKCLASIARMAVGCGGSLVVDSMACGSVKDIRSYVEGLPCG